MPSANRRNLLWFGFALLVMAVAGVVPLAFFRRVESPEELPKAESTAAITTPAAVPATTAAASRRELTGRETRVLDVSQLPDFERLRGRRTTVDFDNLMLSSAVQEFCNQTGLEAITTQQPGVVTEHSVSMHLRSAPFLQCLLEMINEGAGLNDNNAQRVRLVTSRRSPMATGRLCIAGAFATVLESVEHGVPLNQGGQLLPDNQARITLWVFGEPTLKLLEVRTPAIFSELVDEKGQKGEATTFADTALLRSQTTSAGMAMTLTFPATPGKSLVSARGKVMLTLLESTETIRTGSLPYSGPGAPAVAGTAEEKPAAGISVTFEGFTFQRVLQSTPTLAINQYQMVIHFNRKGLDPVRWGKLISILPTIEPVVESSGGLPLIAHGGNISGPVDRSDSIRVVYTISGGLKNLIPDHIQIDIPAGVREVGVPFEFKDVEILQK